MPSYSYILLSWDRCLVVAAGAALGGVARYVVTLLTLERFGTRFPFGTIGVNVTGSFLVGFLAILLTERFSEPHHYWRLFLIVGLLGGYTTFSSFEFETWLAFRDGDRLAAVVNLAGSVLLGYAAVVLGAFLAPRR